VAGSLGPRVNQKPSSFVSGSKATSQWIRNILEPGLYYVKFIIFPVLDKPDLPMSFHSATAHLFCFRVCPNVSWIPYSFLLSPVDLNPPFCVGLRSHLLSCRVSWARGFTRLWSGVRPLCSRQSSFDWQHFSQRSPSDRFDGALNLPVSPSGVLRLCDSPLSHPDIGFRQTKAGKVVVPHGPFLLSVLPAWSLLPPHLCASIAPGSGCGFFFLLLKINGVPPGWSLKT